MLPAFTAVPAHCVVQTAVEQPEGGYALTLDCTSTAFGGTQSVTGQATGDAVVGWTLSATNSPDLPVTLAGEALVGLAFDPQIFFLADLTDDDNGQHAVPGAGLQRHENQDQEPVSGDQAGRTPVPHRPGQ